MSSDTPPAAADGHFVSYCGRVGPDWIDANQHMNTSWYDRVFDIAEIRLFEEFGVNDASIKATGFTMFRLEKLVEYRRENMLNDEIEVRSRIVWTDFKRIHQLHEMWNLTRGHRSAYADCISIHVDLRLRKGVEIVNTAMRTALARYLAASKALPSPVGTPERVKGRRIGR